MHAAISAMLQKYDCHTERDYTNALKEIFQEIALLGLWRAKFFEHAAFYGGSALRILYQLDRFSEDLDFSLLKANPNFSIEQYNAAIVSELKSFGFEVEFKKKIKNIDSHIESAFIKANTKQQLLEINVGNDITDRIHFMKTIKIKMEIDIDPPGNFNTESKTLLMPIPFSVLSFALPDLFAGKIHALLCRKWKQRVKGRDWYDFVWYVGRGIPVNLQHLQTRLAQSNDWDNNKQLNLAALKDLLTDKISAVDFKQAKDDVMPFLKDSDSIALWSDTFFEDLCQHLTSS